MLLFFRMILWRTSALLVEEFHTSSCGELRFCCAFLADLLGGRRSLCSLSFRRIYMVLILTTNSHAFAYLIHPLFPPHIPAAPLDHPPSTLPSPFPSNLDSLLSLEFRSLDLGSSSGAAACTPELVVVPVEVRACDYLPSPALVAPDLRIQGYCASWNWWWIWDGKFCALFFL